MHEIDYRTLLKGDKTTILRMKNKSRKVLNKNLSKKKRYKNIRVKKQNTVEEE